MDVAADFFNLKVWDFHMERKPVAVIPVHGFDFRLALLFCFTIFWLRSFVPLVPLLFRYRFSSVAWDFSFCSFVLGHHSVLSLAVSCFYS